MGGRWGGALWFGSCGLVGAALYGASYGWRVYHDVGVNGWFDTRFLDRPVSALIYAAIWGGGGLFFGLILGAIIGPLVKREMIGPSALLFALVLYGIGYLTSGRTTREAIETEAFALRHVEEMKTVQEASTAELRNPSELTRYPGTQPQFDEATKQTTMVTDAKFGDVDKWYRKMAIQIPQSLGPDEVTMHIGWGGSIRLLCHITGQGDQTLIVLSPGW